MGYWFVLVTLSIFLQASDASLFAQEGVGELPPKPEERFLVQVILESSGEPAPFATIYQFDYTQHEEYLWPKPKNGDYLLQDMFELHGTPFQTNELGQVRMPNSPGGFAILGATQGDSFGWFWTVLENDQTKLSIIPNKTFKVQLSSASGDPLGNRKVSLSREAVLGMSFPIYSFTTNDQGMATLRLHPKQMTLTGSGKVYLQADILGGPLVRAQVDFDLPPQEPIHLQLPPLGDLRVILVDEQGNPPQTACHVQLKVLDQGSGKHLSQSYVDTEDGSILFENVVLGRTIHLTALEHLRMQEAIFEIPDFRPDHGLETITLTLAPTSIFVTGTLLDHSKNPLRDKTFETSTLRKLANRFSKRGDPLKTDSEGKFRYVYKPESFGPGTSFSVTVLPLKEQIGENGVVRIDLSDFLDPQEIALGSLEFEMAPSIATGQVLDAKGRPIAGAHVIVEEQVIHPSSAREYWFAFPFVECWSDEDGVYRLHGVLDSGTFRFSATASGFHPTVMPFVDGRSKVDLYLRHN